MIALMIEVLIAIAIDLVLAVVVAPGDALRTTLMIVPWVIVALRQICRHLMHSRVSLPPSGTTIWRSLLIATGLVVTGAALRHHFGWPASDALWVGMLVVLLAIAILQLVPALRRLLGQRLSTTPSWVFFALPLVVYFAIQPWRLQHHPPDGDEPYYLLLTHSLAFDFDVDLANNYQAGDAKAFLDRPLQRQPGDPKGDDGAILSRHNALLPLLLAPAYRIAGRTGAAACIGLLTALLAWLFLRSAARLWPDRPAGALLAYLLLAFTPPMLTFSYQVWVEVPAAVLCLLALDLIASLDLDHQPAARSRGRILILALVLVLLPLLKIRFLLITAALTVLAVVRLGRRHTARRWLLAPLALSIVAFLAFNLWRYGNPLKMYRRGELDILVSPLSSYARGAIGMFFDCAFGLFAAAPIWLLLVPAVLWTLRHRSSLMVYLAVVSGPYLLAVAPRIEWYGGWAPPFRYPLVFLPLFAVLLVPLLDQRRPALRALWLALGSISLMLTVMTIAVPGWTSNLADGSSRLLHLASIHLGADVSRFFPSTLRPRAATWWWPIGTLIAAMLVLWLDSRRRSASWRRHAGLVGLLLPLVVLAGLPTAAHIVPTSVVEAEDSWVKKSDGTLVPRRWVLQRPKYRSGWQLPAGATLTVPVVSGGSRLQLHIAAANPPGDADTIDLLADGEVIDSWHVPEISGWQDHTFSPQPWPEDAVLSLRARVAADTPARPRRHGRGVLVDHLQLDWLEAK